MAALRPGTCGTVTPPPAEVRDGDARDGEVRDGGRRGPVTTRRAWSGGLPGKHQVADDEVPGEDIRDARDCPGPRAGSDGPGPGPRHGSAPAAPGPAPVGSRKIHHLRWADSPSALGDPPSAQGDSQAAALGRLRQRRHSQETHRPPLRAARRRPVPGRNRQRPRTPPTRPPGDQAAASDSPADPVSRGSITDTMAAELAGWAAGELPGPGRGPPGQLGDGRRCRGAQPAAGPPRKRRNRHGTGELAEYPHAESGLHHTGGLVPSEREFRMMRRRARPGFTRVAGVLAVLRGRAHRLRRSERRRAARRQSALAQRRI